MRISTYTLLFHTLHTLIITVVHVKSDWLTKCGDCKCKWNSGKKTADCKNISLAAIPENLSSELQVLDLSYNRIAYIEANTFGTADLQNLHKLFMRNCSLAGMDLHALQGLEILIELDLSNNRLRALARDLFVGLVKVRSLLLNANLLESLDGGVFRNLKYLHKVELRGNRLARISTEAFANVPLLSQIFLSGNRLAFLRLETFERLKRLASLSLEMNPWNCTCELHPFREFVLKRNLYTPPTACHYPATLRGMLWTDDQPEAFACKPRIIYPSRGASINTSKENVTLVCRVNTSPNTLIAWDYNKQLYGSGGNYQARVHIQLLREESHPDKEFGRDVFISRLTIVGAEKSDEGVYTCLAENAGGRDEVQMSLLVQSQSPKDALIQNNLVIVICLMVLGLLSASIFLAMITCCIYKRFKAINLNHHRRQHHHHHHGDDNGVAPHHLHHHHHHHQHHPQKATMNGLNTLVVGGGDNQNSDEKYAEIKHGKVANGNVQHLNTYIDVKDTDEYYREKINNDKFLQQTKHSLNGSSHKLSDNPLAGHHRPTDEQQVIGIGVGVGGDYQPDLLPPHIPQSMSFNNSNSIYNYPINPTSACESQLYHQQNTINYPPKQRTIKHPQEDNAKPISSTDNLRYANSLTKTKYNIGQSGSEYMAQSKLPPHPQHGGRLGATLGNHPKPNPNALIDDRYHPNELHPFYAPTTKQLPPPPPPYYAETMGLDADNGVGSYNHPPEVKRTIQLHDSIVTTSPSLNYLSDYNQRRELL